MLFVSRLLPLLVLVNCGGFHTPEQNVSVGLGLTSKGLPPKLVQGGHTLVLDLVRLTGTVSAQAKGASRVEVIAVRNAVAPLNSSWTELAAGPLTRGDYSQLRLELNAFALDGSFDATPFHLESAGTKAIDLNLPGTWQVSLGQMSALSFVCDPLRWMTKGADPLKPEIIEPTDEKASTELLDRVFQSLTAARDDNHDGVDDGNRRP